MLGFQLGNFLRVTDTARNNAVYQRAAEGAVLVDVLLEAVLKAPLLDVLVDALEQLLAVVVNQLAGQHNDALLACLVAVVQHLGQLAGEAGCGDILQLAGRVIDDACLGGVGNDDFQIIAGGNLHHLLEALLLIRIQAAGNAGNDALVIDLLAVFTAAQIEGVQTLLLVNHLGQARGDGLNQNALAVPAGLLVGQIKPVINECTQEVALAKLQDLLGCILQDIAVVAGFCQNFIIQGFHKRFSLYTQFLCAVLCRSTPCYLHCIFFRPFRQDSFCKERTYFALFFAFRILHNYTPRFLAIISVNKQFLQLVQALFVMYNSNRVWCFGSVLVRKVCAIGPERLQFDLTIYK